MAQRALQQLPVAASRPPSALCTVHCVEQAGAHRRQRYIFLLIPECPPTAKAVTNRRKSSKWNSQSSIHNWENSFSGKLLQIYPCTACAQRICVKRSSMVSTAYVCTVICTWMATPYKYLLVCHYYTNWTLTAWQLRKIWAHITVCF